MNKTSKATILICGGTSIAATIIFYLLAFDNIFTIPIRWLSLVFLLLAEAIGTIKAIGVKKTIFGVANITASLIHLCVVLVASILFVNILHLKTYILLNILALCALLVVDVIITYFCGYISNKNQKLSENQAILDSCYTKAKSIYTEFITSEYKNELNEITEMLQYSDNSSLTSDEMDILNKLDELQSALTENNESTHDKIMELKNLIKLRSIKIKSQKRGGY
jgi:hypothetical protein